MALHGHVVTHAGGPAQGEHHQPIKRDEHNQQPVHGRLPSIDGCAIIAAIRAAASSRRAASPTASSRPLPHVQTGMRVSRLPLDTEQDIRDDLIKSFMCDHYSRQCIERPRTGIRQDTGPAAARNIGCTARPRRSDIGNGHFLLSVAEKENFKWDQTIAPPPPASETESRICCAVRHEFSV